MTTKEAFKDLIAKRKWYAELGISETAAWSLAKRVNDGQEVSTDKMEELLEKAGYKVIQEKKWEI
jgi:hypothetical protein